MSAGSMPRSRRQRRRLGGALRPTAQGCPGRRVCVEVSDLSAGVHAGVGAPRHGEAHRFAGAQQGGQGGRELPLDGAQTRLSRPAGEVGAVVAEVEADPQGRGRLHALLVVHPASLATGTAPTMPVGGLPEWAGEDRHHRGADRCRAGPAPRGRRRRLRRPGPAVHLPDHPAAEVPGPVGPVGAVRLRAPADGRAAGRRRVGPGRAGRHPPGQCHDVAGRVRPAGRRVGRGRRGATTGCLRGRARRLRPGPRRGGRRLQHAGGGGRAPLRPHHPAVVPRRLDGGRDRRDRRSRSR